MASAGLPQPGHPAGPTKRQTRRVWRLSRTSNSGTPFRATWTRSPQPAEGRLRSPSSQGVQGIAQRSLARCQSLTCLHREEQLRRRAGGYVSEQHSSCDARSSAFRTSRCPDTHREGRPKQGARDNIQGEHQGSRRSPDGEQLTPGVISVAVALVQQVPKDVTYDIQHRGDDTAAQQDLSYHPSPLCPWVFSISMTQVGQSI